MGMTLFDRWALIGLWTAVAVAATALCAFTAVTLTLPVFDGAGFRQAQTAITTFSLIHDGVSVDYLTPVLGAPWSIPFEVPIYQLIVAALHAATGINLDAVGRLVSLAFYFGVLWLGYDIMRRLLPGDRNAAGVFVLLALVSPHYVFWSRTFMIETCALFFATAWLWCVLREPDRKSLPFFLLSVPLCAAAVLAKATTWPAFVLAYVLLLLVRTGAPYQSRLCQQSSA